MPLWLAVVLPVAAYVVRSAMRGFDLRPDMPIDAIVLALYVFVLAAAFFSRRAAAKETEHDADTEEHEEHHES